MPADLLRRRPDIRRAERLAAAQCANIGIAESELYPAFSLLGSLGLQTGDSSSSGTRGDDIGDLPAFHALQTLRAEGRSTCGVAVRSSEVPRELLEIADRAVDGQAGVRSLLEDLARDGQLVG